MHLEMWAEVKVHSYHAMRTCVLVVVCVARKLRLCPSHSGRRDRNNSVHWRTSYKGGGYPYPTLSPFFHGVNLVPTYGSIFPPQNVCLL